MRTASAILIGLAAVAGMVPLLMREETQVWQLVGVGAVGGVLAGGVRWGRRGALVGLAAGCLLGLIAPFLYIPFWLVFTLPPHPEYDL
jgi:Na+/proline symporter